MASLAPTKSLLVRPRAPALASPSIFGHPPRCIISVISPSHLFSVSSTHGAHLHRSFLGFSSNPNFATRRCRVFPGPTESPSPPQPDPPPANENQRSPAGIGATLSRFKESLQIFFAVFFWLSLFYWSSAWDDKNKGGGNKGNRFRR
ncbi:hypothetical protein Drorol1_Dr00013577 [Drosera rotundifolia]